PVASTTNKNDPEREHCKRGYLKSNVVANPTQIPLLDERSVKMQLSSLKRKAAFYLSAVPFVLPVTSIAVMISSSVIARCSLYPKNDLVLLFHPKRASGSIADII